MKIVEFPFAKLEFFDNYVIITYAPDSYIDIDEAEKIVLAIAQEFPDVNKPFGVVNDISKIHEITRKARDYFAHHTRPNVYNALIINKFLQSVLVKIYFSFSKPIDTTDVFNNIQDAINWIEMQLNK